MPKFCVIDCENSRLYDPMTFGIMFQTQLSREGDTWSICYLAHGESLPDDILEYQGVVITGSHFNCRDGGSLPWFQPLCEFIRRCAVAGAPQLYGGCYGCQIIAHALEGEVDYNPSGRFLLMAEHVRLAADVSIDDIPLPSALIEKLRSPDGMHLLVSHGDCVRKVPGNALLIAASESCGVEMYLAGSRRNILACQSHPEFDYQYAIKDRIWPSVTANGRLNEEEKELYIATFMTYTGDDARLMMTAISDFLHLRV